MFRGFGAPLKKKLLFCQKMDARRDDKVLFCVSGTGGTLCNGREWLVLPLEAANMSEQTNSAPVAPKRPDVPLCKFFALGTCRFGSNCKFLHTTLTEQYEVEISVYFTGMSASASESWLQDKLSAATPSFDGDVAKASEYDALAVKGLHNVADPNRPPRRCNDDTALCAG